MLDSSVGGDMALLEARAEFVSKYRAAKAAQGSGQPKKSPWVRPKPSVAISNRRVGFPLEDTTEAAAYLVAEVEEQLKVAREKGTLSSLPPSVFPSESSPPPSLPLLASSCPGWICYAEKTNAEVLPYIATTKSPQAIMGTIVKQMLAKNLGVQANDIYHATIMPCFDKKLEASRKDFLEELSNSREVDCVLTPGEIVEMMEEKGVAWDSLSPGTMDSMEALFVGSSADGARLLGAVAQNNGSGGYTEHIFRHAAKELYGVVVEGPLQYQCGRNADMKEVSLEVDGAKVLTFAVAYGFRNIQAILRKIKLNKCPYDYVEIMACPGGCLNGGGQIKPADPRQAKELVGKVSDVYHDYQVRDPADSVQVKEIYREFLGGNDFNGPQSQELLHTRYHAVPSFVNPFTIKW